MKRALLFAAFLALLVVAAQAKANDIVGINSVSVTQPKFQLSFHLQYTDKKQRVQYWEVGAKNISPKDQALSIYDIMDVAVQRSLTLKNMSSLRYTNERRPRNFWTKLGDIFLGFAKAISGGQALGKIIIDEAGWESIAPAYTVAWPAIREFILSRSRNMSNETFWDTRRIQIKPGEYQGGMVLVEQVSDSRPFWLMITEEVDIAPSILVPNNFNAPAPLELPPPSEVAPLLHGAKWVLSYADAKLPRESSVVFEGGVLPYYALGCTDKTLGC